MPNCNYQVRGKNCEIEIEEPEEEMCYVHSCITQNKPIESWHKLKRFIERHRYIFTSPEDNPEAMIFDFEFNFIEFYHTFDKGGFVAQNLTLENIIFKKEARFNKKKLNRGLYIVKCTFENKASFEKTIFSDTGRTETHILNHKLERVNFNEGADFTNTIFRNTIFKDTDFSKCIFYKSEFKNCNFVNVKWAKIGKIFGRKHAFFDETFLNYKNKDYIEKLSDLEKTYRSLKALAKNAEDRDMEGGFNYSENEMIRKRTKWYKQLFTSKFWFFLVSRYAERPAWAFLNIFFIIFIFSFFYLFSGVGIINSTENVNFHTINLSNWPYLIAHAFSPVTLNKWQLTTAPNLVTYFLSIFEGGLLATQIGLFVMALRRKFQR